MIKRVLLVAALVFASLAAGGFVGYTAGAQNQFWLDISPKALMLAKTATSKCPAKAVHRIAEIFLELGNEGARRSYAWMARMHPAHAVMAEAFDEYRSQAESALAAYDAGAAKAGYREPSQ